MVSLKHAAPYLICALIVAAFAWYYFIFRAFPVSIGFTNAVVAFSAVIVLGFSFILGPLAKFHNFFRAHLEYRKDFGLIGFSLASLHVLLVVPLLIQEGGEVTLADVVSIAVAAVAFMIFILMALTSTSKWMTTLGYENWKGLQRTGYIAIALLFAHMALLEQGILFGRLTGQIALGFI
ncbi:MAG: ferric reductase-like transmembrane domain-containing protein, partial [archaeon]|nr:ferric reductase-like transmembrane domain-containing protein [archaeon]